VEKKQTKKQHGGPRPGAGRPRTLANPASPTSVILEKDVLNQLDGRAAALGITRSRAIQLAVEAWLKRRITPARSPRRGPAR
jgi:hypothetical protein